MEHPSIKSAFFSMVDFSLVNENGSYVIVVLAIGNVFLANVSGLLTGVFGYFLFPRHHHEVHDLKFEQKIVIILCGRRFTHEMTSYILIIQTSINPMNSSCQNLGADLFILRQSNSDGFYTLKNWFIINILRILPPEPISS